MSARASFTLDDRATVAGLKGSLERARDLRPALTAIARVGVNFARRCFQTSRAPDGAAWAPLKHRVGKPLIKSGLLLRSISDRPPTADSVEWGSNRVYAAVHQYGIDEPVQIPAHTRVVNKVFGRRTSKPVTQNVGAHSRQMTETARPYLGENAEMRAAWSRILVRHHAEPLVGPLPGEAG
jgi:phage gpG-like protein